MAQRLILITAALVVLIALFFIFQSRLAAPTAPTAAGTIAARVDGNALDPATITLDEGAQTILTLTSTRRVRFHLHGYDLERTLTPGEPVSLTFTATLTGRFTIEDEDSGAQLGTLLVQPRGGR